MNKSRKKHGKTNPVTALRNRQLYGTNQGSYPNVKNIRVFPSLPKRLVYSLQEIVDREILIDEAHVFIGFNSEGTMLLSYTETYSEEVADVLSYVYKLHWWLFKFDKKLEKLSSIKLFENEEITTSLLLNFTEWPVDKSKLVVYGRSINSDVCYITVAAVPTFRKCLQCDRTKELCNINYKSCFKHGYSVHMKHASVSPNTNILNTIGLKIDNLLVLNMGHSILVISVGILDNKSCSSSLPLSTINQATFEETVGSNYNEDVMSQHIEETAHPQSNEHTNQLFEDMETSLKKNKHESTDQNFDVYSFPLSSETTNDVNVSIKQHKVFNENYNAQYSSLDLSQCSCSNKMPPPELKKNVTQKELSKKEYSFDPFSDFSSEPKSIVLSKPRKPILNYSENLMHNSYSSPKTTSRLGRRKLGIYSSTNKEKMPLSPVQDRSVSMKYRDFKENANTLCSYCGIKTISNQFVSSKSSKTAVEHNSSPLNISRLRKVLLTNFKEKACSSALSSELNVPTPSPSASESSGSVYCLGESSNTVSIANNRCSSSKRGDGVVSFCETFYDEPICNERSSNPNAAMASNDESSSFFNGPVTFQNNNRVPLMPIQNVNKAINPIAFSQQLTLDIEHVIFDVLRTRCYITYKFGLLIDYDVQIVDTCPEIRSVIILIVALLDVSPKLKQDQTKNFLTNTKKQFQFYLSWSLITGRYEVVAASPLKPLEEGNNQKWDVSWIAEVCANIRRAVAVPKQNCVYSLNNMPVIKGKSLSYFWHPDQIVVIKR